MNSNQLLNPNSYAFKHQARLRAQLCFENEENILSKKTFGQISKIKQFHQSRKIKNIQRVKSINQQKAEWGQNFIQKIAKKKSIQVQKTNLNPIGQTAQNLKICYYQYPAKYVNRVGPKYACNESPLKMKSEKNIYSHTKYRKDSTNSNIQEYCSYQKLRFNSPDIKLKKQFKLDNFISSARSLECPQQIKSQKKIGLPEDQTNKNQVISYLSLKESVSTSPSKKPLRTIKISDFQLGRQLGKGKFGVVKMARHKKTGMVFSIKIISKQMIIKDKIINQLIKETKIQSFLNHSHIVKLYEVFEDDQNIYLLMELCCEGNLYEYMQKIGKIPQQQASQYMKETCQAVSQLHFNKIIHRDIKPENIVLCFGMVKICDFGWSTQIKGTMRQTFCGSPLYISPQLLKGQLYDQKVDLWALGILGYEMMTGTIPFQILTQRDLGKIITSRIIYPGWMSSLTKSFLQELLQKNPQDRTRIQQILQHPFLRKKIR